MIKARIKYFDKELGKIFEENEVIPTKNKDRIKLLLDKKVAYEVEEPKKESKASAEK